jgi:hypothetical protein
LVQSLVGIDPSDKAAKPRAIAEIKRLMNVIIMRAKKDDPDYGHFLAELLTYLWKNRKRLSANNTTFREVFEKLQSSRPATLKESGLRARINGIIAEAKHRKLEQELQNISNVNRAEFDRPLLSLPDFGPSDHVVDQWTETIVYPALRATKDELARDPKIRGLKKPWDENGKFQISRLKVLIRQTVARIARQPRSYYFDLS